MADEEKTETSPDSGVDEVIEASLGKLKRKNPVRTGGRREFRLIRPEVKVVEMEDVLFHFNSCVLMPSAPEGKSSGQGSEDMTPEEQERADLQKRITGLHALALTYKVLDEHNTLGILITGHTDTSGGTQGNFILSEQRANNVLFLLEQKREDWANLCFERHRVEDYQQILKHFAGKKPEFNCDPGDIDNDYGDKTHTASENYFAANGLDPELANKAKFDGQHRWPIEAWLVTFDLYDQEIDEILEKASGIPLKQRGPEKVQTCSPPETEDKPKPRNARLRFASTARKILGCGESFPIQNALKDNYKSQENRRVEILFFNQGDLPDLLLPEDRTKKLTGDDVPIFIPTFFGHIYVDPFDIFAVTYHLRFVYYNRLTKKIEPVPEGLKIKAFDDKDKEIKCKTEFDNGNYVVKVGDDENRKSIRFEFETADQWIEMNSGGGKIVTRKVAEVRALRLPRRIKFYDLPREWSSRNYWTRHSGSMDSADRFDVVMELRLALKPHGNNRTTPKQPLVFSLDDIVLVDENDRQTVFDRNQFDVKRSLSANSRFSMFHIFDNKLTLYDPDPDNPQFTLQKLEENLIHKTPVETRLIIFAGRFYDVWDKRAGQGGAPFNPATDIKGCRAAVQDDPDCRFGERIRNSGASISKPHPYHAPNTGHFDLHYIHTGCVLPGEKQFVRSFLMIYWSARFKAHFNSKPDVLKKDKKKVTKAEMEKFGKEGFKNTKERWELKEYMIEPTNPKKDENLEIQPVFWFEPKDDKRGGSHHCLVSISNDPDTANMGITDSQMYRLDFEPRADTNGGVTHTDTHDELKAKNLVAGHEIGHAMGKPDEYLYNDKNDPWRQHLPGVPYLGGNLSIMNQFMAFPRLRHLWNFVNWLNDSATAAGKLKDKLDGLRFRIGYFFVTIAEGDFQERKLNFFLEDEFRNIYRPFKSAPSLSLKTGSAEMSLYAWGEDETSISPKVGGKRPPFAFGGRLAVFWRLSFRFINNPKKPSEKWTDAMKNSFMREITAEILALRNKIYIALPKTEFRSGADAKVDTQFANTSIALMAQGFENKPAGQANFHITAVLRHDAKINKRNGKLLEVGNDTSRRWIAKYLLGIDDGATEAPISATDPDIDIKTVDFMRDWVRSELGNNKFEYRDSFPPASTA